jgi:hypothetical protein
MGIHELTCPYGGCCSWVVLNGFRAIHLHQGIADTLKGVTYARTQNYHRNSSAARRLGYGASGSGADCGGHRHSTGLFVRLLRLCAIRLRALWILRAGVLLQRHIPGHGSLGRLGLWPWLGRTSLQGRWWWKLPRRRRRRGQSQQFCTRRLVPKQGR